MSQQTIEETKEFLNQPEISIWIDKYDDVFSDFDSRPFAERALSDDFLREVRKMASEKTGGEIELKFNILDDQRNVESEAVIINSLNKHFKNIATTLRSEQRQTLQKGYMLLGAGFSLMIFLVYLTTIPTKGAYLNGIYLMLEPVGWFMTWTGLDNVFQNTRKNKSALDFNSRMAFAAIKFSSFDTVVEAETKQQKTVIPFDNSNLRVA
ncbi:MAG: hypothetical protein JWO06_540 [Bacteroidota bacterium]|nr:hypothetical protein [Bacteroidota bacterium]